jgi:hypothetical protein
MLGRTFSSTTSFQMLIDVAGEMVLAALRTSTQDRQCLLSFGHLMGSFQMATI